MLPPSSSRTMLTTLFSARDPGFPDSIMSHATAPIATTAPSSTNVSNPLRLDRGVKRRGFFGSFRFGSFRGGGAALADAGWRARPKRLARGLSLPSPGLLSLMRSPVSRFDAATRHRRPGAREAGCVRSVRERPNGTLYDGDF